MLAKQKETSKEEKTMTEAEKYDVMSTPVSELEGNKIYVNDESEVVDAKPDVKSVDDTNNAKPAKVEVVEEKVVEPAKEDFFDKMERELVKDEGKEDLTSFTAREKAYYHQMRRDRKQRQKAESERDEALFREMKLKKEKEVKPEVVEDDDPFKDRADDDLMTVEDMKKLLKKTKKEEPKVEVVQQEKIIDITNPTTKKFLDLCDKEARQTHQDYDEVIDLANEIISNNSKYQEDLANCFYRGENPALRMYELIKSDAEFDKLYPVAQTRVKARKGKTDKPAPAVDVAKEKKAQEAQEALEKNKTKVKTSAHAVGSEEGQSGELTIEEINKMSSREFAKLPKKTRDKILLEFGG